MKRQYINMISAPVFYSIESSTNMPILEKELLKYNYLKGCIYYDFKTKDFEKIMEIIIVPSGDSIAWRLYFQALDYMPYDKALKKVYDWSTEFGPNFYSSFTIVCVLERKSTGSASNGRNVIKNLGYVIGCIDVSNSLN